MFNTFRKKTEQTSWFGGLHVTSCCRRLEAALVGISGSGTETLIKTGYGLSFDLPEYIRHDYYRVRGPDKNGAKNGVKQDNKGNDKGLSSFGKEAGLPLLPESRRGTTPRLSTAKRNSLSDIQEETLRELLTVANVAPSDLLVVGVNDPGVWFAENFSDMEVGKSPRIGDFEKSVCQIEAMRPVFREPLSDTTTLATRTGYNVLDALPATDLSVGGHGGPFFPLACWALLHSGERHRLLLDLGQEARITFLPNSSREGKRRIGYGSAGACGSVIDPIVQALTRGEQTIDEGGRLSVQGEKLPELREFLARLETLDVPSTPMHWSPFAPILAARQTNALFAQIRLKDWSLRDTLCTVVESVACRIARAVRQQFGPILSDVELIVTGGGRHHGILMKTLQRELGCEKLVLLETLGYNPEIFDATATAVLTALTVNQVPGNLPHLTGAETDRVLGRFLPGSPQNWQRLVRLMADIKPAVRSLRSAV